MPWQLQTATAAILIQKQKTKKQYMRTYPITSGYLSVEDTAILQPPFKVGRPFGLLHSASVEGIG